MEECRWHGLPNEIVLTTGCFGAEWQACVRSDICNASSCANCEHPGRRRLARVVFVLVNRSPSCLDIMVRKCTASSSDAFIHNQPVRGDTAT